LDPGLFNLEATIGTTLTGTAPTSVSPGDPLTLTDVKTSLDVPALLSTGFALLGATTASGSVTNFGLDVTNSSTPLVNAAAGGLPYGPVNVVAGQNLTLPVPNTGPFTLNLGTETGAPGDVTLLSLDTTPGFTGDSLSGFTATGSGIVSTVTGLTATGTKIGPLPIVCNAPATKLGSVAVVSSGGSTTTSSTTTPTSSTTSTPTTTTTSSTTTPTTSSTTSSTTTSTTTSTAPPPRVAFVFPNQGHTFDLVFIFGSGFRSAQTVSFGHAAAPFVSLGDSLIVAIVPFGPSHGVRTVDVTVTNRAGATSVTSRADRFRFVPLFGLFGLFG